MKRVISVLFLFLFVFTLCSCKGDKIMEDYPSLTDKRHIYAELSADSFLSKIENDETFVIIFGFPKCPWCQAIIPILNEVGKELGLKKIYYMDILDMRDNTESIDHPKYLEIKELLTEALDKEKDRLNAPTTVVIQNGELLNYHLDTVESHTIVDGVLPPLTDEQINELKQILKDMINPIL